MLDPFFSRRNVLNLEHIVQAKAEKLSDIVSSRFARNETVDLHHTFRSISVDVITDYAFGESYDLMDKKDLGAEFFAMVSGIGPTMWFFQQWPGIQKLVLALPPALVKMMKAPLKQTINLREGCTGPFTFCKADRCSTVGSKPWL
jgi:hypothetical protein